MRDLLFAPGALPPPRSTLRAEQSVILASSHFCTFTPLGNRPHLFETSVPTAPFGVTVSLNSSHSTMELY